jgi:predicted peptidase
MQAQDTSLFSRRSFKVRDTLPYRLLLPENYDPAQKYPVVFFLHGSGERGNDNALQLVHGAKLFLNPNNRKRFPAFVVFPQCPQNSYWSNQQTIQDSSGKSFRHFPTDIPPTRAMVLLMGLVDHILESYSVNKEQVYVGGLSMGGMGTFELAWRKTGLFAAAFPICGGGNPSTAEKLKDIKWWVFHGAKDNVVLPEYSTVMVRALEEAGASVKYTHYPDANHNSWDPAFAEPGLLEWLFSQKRK